MVFPKKSREKYELLPIVEKFKGLAMSILVVDILCCKSLYKVIKLRDDINTVYFCSLSKSVSMILKQISRLSHIQFKDFSEFPASTLYKNQRSCYEEIQDRLTHLCNLYFKSLEDDPVIIECCRTNQLDLRLAKEHLRQNAYWLFHRPVEMAVKSELLNAEDGICFLLRKSPVIHILAPMLTKNNVKLLLYQYLGLSYFLVNRDEYVLDEYIKQAYFNNPLFHVVKTLRAVLLLVVNSFCCEKLGNKTDRNPYQERNNANIGVDKYLQSAEEDCFWFRGSHIDPETIYYFEERRPSAENVRFLAQNKIRRSHIVNNPIEWFKKKANGSMATRQLLSADWGNVKKLLGLYLAQWLKGVGFYDSERKWKTLMLLQLQISYELWKNVFQQLGIKLLISMSDIDYMNAAKTMAADFSNGVVLGGLLSNIPLYTVSTERFYHVAFAWGPHFHSHIFGRYPYRTVVVTGYYLDYKFKDHNAKASVIRGKYPDKFIVTFMDNSFYQDVAYSAETIQTVYKLFFDIIDSYPQVIFFVKTKRAEVFNKARKLVPAINNYIRHDKLVPFINDPDTNQPYKPACVALASDLVIGLGISSAATESQFAGVPSFHFDLASTANNQFARKGLGTVVFQSVKSMRKAIERQINRETALSFEKIDRCYNDLDPFRDGRAAERIGTYLKWLLDGFTAGLSSEAAMANAAERYCSEWGYDKIISTPHANLQLKSHEEGLTGITIDAYKQRIQRCH
jgi:hypothetical protein